MKIEIKLGVILFTVLLMFGCGQDEDVIEVNENSNSKSITFKTIVLDYGVLDIEYSDDNIFENYDPMNEDYYIENETLYVTGVNLFSRPNIKLKTNQIEYIDAVQWSDIDFSNTASFENMTVELGAFCNVDSAINLNGGNFTLINEKPGGDTIRINSVNTNTLNIVAGHLSPTECVGSVEELIVDLRGASGHFLGFDLDANSITATSRGIGKIEVSTEGILNAEINSIGNIYYKGNPEIELDDNGLGDLINAN